MAKYEDHQSSSYDLEHCDWSDLPEDNFILHEDLPYCIGEFVWTGFDYRGEPSPFGWPAVSSYFGCMDLCGFPKTAFYIRQALWAHDRPVGHEPVVVQSFAQLASNPAELESRTR